MIKLHICDFWNDFDYKNNLFVKLFKEIYPDCLLTNKENANLILSADVNIQNKIDVQKQKCIYYTGEPNNIDFLKYDYVFSFDPSINNNIRFPLWLLYINHNQDYSTDENFPIGLKEIDNNRWLRTEKKNFCVAPFSAIKQNRIDYFNLLSSYKPITGFGIPFGNGDTERKIIKKYNFISNFKFCMAFENTNKLGYITEKLFQAKLCGCIPIYWGNYFCKNDFNEKSFINVLDWSDPKEFLEYISLIDQNKDLYESFQKQSLFKTSFYDIIENIKTNIKEKILL